MEFLNSLLTNEAFVAAAGAIGTAVFAFLWARGRALAAKTENKIDDLLWEAFDEGYTQAKEQADKAKAAEKAPE